MNRPGTSNGETDGKSRSSPKKSPAEGGGYRRPAVAILIISFIVMATVGAFALGEPDDGVEGTNDDKCGDNLVYAVNGTVLTITGYGDMYNYSEEKPAPWWEKGITSVNFQSDEGDHITSIGNAAFLRCTQLQSVNTLNYIVRIGNEAFAESGLSGTIYISSSTTEIGDCAFRNCQSLTTISVDSSNSNYSDTNGVLFSKDKKTLIQYPAGDTSRTTYKIPSTVTTIGAGAFYGCTGLTSVTFKDPTISSLGTIGDEAFYGCTGLTSLDILDKVTTIGNKAFYGCTGLTSLDIPDSVTSIGDEAFYNCNGLTAVTFGTKIATVGTNVFGKGDAYTKFDTLESKDTAFSQEKLNEFKGWMFTGSITKMFIVKTVTDDGVVYEITKDGEGSYSVHVTGYDKNVTLGNTEISSTKTFGHNELDVTTINVGAFASCGTLTAITIPDSVTSIGKSAFNGCENLTSVTISGAITSIPESAFSGCASLNTITITDGSKIESIGDNAFKGCKQMAFGIPTSVTSIGDNAFDGCERLGSIDISSVSTLGSSAFKGCTGLKSVTFGSSLLTIEDSAFSGCTSLTSIDIPKNITAIEKSAFQGCTGLKSVTFENPTESSLSKIGESAFSGCETLESVAFPDSVTSIGDKAFAGCDGLTSITFGNSKESSLTTIANDAFCDSKEVLTKFYDAYGNKLSPTNDIDKFKGQTFTGDISVMSIKVPGIYCYKGVVYKYDVKTGEAFVLEFNEATLEEDTTILDSFSDEGKTYRVTSIGAGAFEDCTKLTSVTIPDSVETIGEKAFGGCDSLETIVFGNGITDIAEDAFCNSTGTTTKFNDELSKQISPSSDIAKFRGQTFTGDISEMTIKTLGHCIIDGVIYVVPLSGEAYVYGCNEDIESETVIQGSVTINGVTYKVTSIGAGAFEDCTTLKSVTIPDSVKDIKEYAFLNCTNLETVSFGTGIETVDPTAFSTGKRGGDIVPTVFYDENLNPIDLSAQTEKLRGEMFKGDIYKMTVTRTIIIDDGTSTWIYTGCIGDEIPRPADPTRDGYTFLYWADEDGNVFDWIVPTKDIKITAVWKAVSPSGDDDDDNPPYNPSGKDSGSTGGSDSGSAKILIIVACIAVFMAVLAAYVCSNRR